jgi:hypothetical protein
MEYFGTGSI